MKFKLETLLKRGYSHVAAQNIMTQRVNEAIALRKFVTRVWRDGRLVEVIVK